MAWQCDHRLKTYLLDTPSWQLTWLKWYVVLERPLFNRRVSYPKPYKTCLSLYTKSKCQITLEFMQCKLHFFSYYHIPPRFRTALQNQESLGATGAQIPRTVYCGFHNNPTLVNPKQILVQRPLLTSIIYWSNNQGALRLHYARQNVEDYLSKPRPPRHFGKVATSLIRKRI